MESTTIVYLVVTVMMVYQAIRAIVDKKNYFGKGSDRYTDESKEKFAKYYLVSNLLAAVYFGYLGLVSMEILPDPCNFNERSITSLLIRLAIIIVLMLPMMYGNFAVLKKTDAAKTEKKKKKEEDEDF